MSQVGVSRPATQQSLGGRSGPNLPEIKHPLSRLGNPDTLDVRGVSRAGSFSGSLVDEFRPVSKSYSGRPLNEPGNIPSRLSLRSSSGRNSKLRKSSPAGPYTQVFRHEAIPEGVEVAQGDPNKTRLPIFGNRTELADREEMQSRVASRLSTASAQARLEIDELEILLKEKVKSQFHELKRRFKDNDPENKGNVSRDGLFRIIVTATNRPINSNQFNRLMDRLGFTDRSVISFTEFFTVFRPSQSSDYPRWMDPVQRNDKATMTATQVHAQLKERAKERVRNIADLIPQCNPDGSGHVLKPEFRNVLNQLGFWMDNDEFEKLWIKYDNENIGTINGEKMMQKLGISISRQGSGYGPKHGKENEIPGNGRPLKKKEMERQRSLNIEMWLKSKFREGFANMKEAFEGFDHQKTGQVSHKEFLEVLAQFGLRLEKEHLAEFLARCSVEPTNVSVPYRDFLHKFQDRSEKGMAHNVLTNPKHRYNRSESPGGQSSMSAIETELINMFQRDFLALLGTFHKIDRYGMDYISQEEFRAAIESKFGVEITNDQFQILIDRVPLDSDGNVKYADFMSQFDTRQAKSLFEGAMPAKRPIHVGALPRDGSPSPPPPLEPVYMVQESRMEDDLMVENRPHRSSKELFMLIKDLLKSNYREVEETFYDLDETNTRRLSQESMYQLLRRFDISPEITRGEIRDIWKTFITNQDKTLDFLQFTRHFGYSLRSAAFSNAKISPPKRGDADFMMRSRKLNCAADMLQDSLRSKIDYMWEDLRREFVAMDPYNTGFVSKEEFSDVVTELCVHLSNYELQMLTKRFDTTGDGRISYVEFLKPFALKKQVWRHGNNMLSLLQHGQSELPIPPIVNGPQKGLTGITAKLRQKLVGDWKNLRRAFKKLDSQNNGLLSLPEFRSVLKLANVILDEDEVYHVMSEFDENMSGKIAYNKFLETFKRPESKMV